MAPTRRIRNSLKISILIELIGIGVVLVGIFNVRFSQILGRSSTIMVGILLIAAGSLLFYRYYEGETLFEQLKPNLTKSDEGKPVVTEDGEYVGKIVKVVDETAYVSPNPSLSNEVKSQLGWDEAEKSVPPDGEKSERKRPRSPEENGDETENTQPVDESRFHPTANNEVELVKI